jgi:TolA-binding protein
MHKAQTTILILLFALFSGFPPLFSQDSKTDPKDRLEQGLKQFEKAEYNAALSVFQGIILDAKAKTRHPEAVYWSALAYVGLKDYENADRSIGLFLSSFPQSRLMADAQYQQGRIAFLRQDFERSLKTFQVFIESYPQSDLYPSALFWAGECMFQLGRLQQAERVFLSIVKDYPGGVKTEAANYRLGLIDLKYREEELLKLLKWSHEESLRIIEEYQLREKTYEQAINAYQRQMSGQKVQVTQDQSAKIAELEASLASMRAQNDKNQKEAAALQSALSTAQNELAAAMGKASAPQAENASRSAERGELLDIKDEALKLKEFYLQWLAQHPASGEAQ